MWHLQSHFVCAKLSTEPRDYRVVFVLQKEALRVRRLSIFYDFIIPKD